MPCAPRYLPRRGIPNLHARPPPEVTCILASDAHALHHAIRASSMSTMAFTRHPSIHGGNLRALGECTLHTYHKTLIQAPIMILVTWTLLIAGAMECVV